MEAPSHHAAQLDQWRQAGQAALATGAGAGSGAAVQPAGGGGVGPALLAGVRVAPAGAAAVAEGGQEERGGKKRRKKKRRRQSRSSSSSSSSASSSDSSSSGEETLCGIASLPSSLPTFRSPRTAGREPCLCLLCAGLQWA